MANEVFISSQVQKAAVDFLNGKTVDAITRECKRPREVVIERRIRAGLLAAHISESDRAAALARLDREVRKLRKNQRRGSIQETSTPIEAQTTPPEVDDLAARVAALEPKRPPQRLCGASGVLAGLDGGRTVEGVWLSRLVADKLDADATLADVRDWAVSDRLGLDHRHIGSGVKCGVLLYFETGLTEPNEAPWAHLDVIEVAARFDEAYGPKLTGPTVALHHPSIGAEIVHSNSVRATVPKFGPAVPVVIDPETPVTHGRGPRPPLPHEVEQEGRRAVITRKRHAAGQAKALRARKASALAAVERRFRRVS